jgi:cytochrome d ubiquinol oxidase subunit I
MAGLGFFFIGLFAWAFYLSSTRKLAHSPIFLRVALWALPLPWIAAELGWYVAESGRQPWTIDGVLPTFLSASSVSAGNVWISLAVFVVFYSTLAVVDVMLMLRAIRTGPHAALSGGEDAA